MLIFFHAAPCATFCHPRQWINQKLKMWVEWMKCFFFFNQIKWIRLQKLINESNKTLSTATLDSCLYLRLSSLISNVHTTEAASRDMTSVESFCVYRFIKDALCMCLWSFIYFWTLFLFYCIFWDKIFCPFWFLKSCPGLSRSIFNFT